MRCAAAHAIIKTVAAVAGMFLIAPLACVTEAATQWLWRGGASVERLIANGHTVFNMVNVLVCLPFVNMLARVFVWLIPPRADERVFPALRMTPESALADAADRQHLRDALAASARMAQDMAAALAQQCERPDVDALEQLGRADDRMDRGYREIQHHALLLMRLPGHAAARRAAEQIVRTAEILERLADDLSRSVPRNLYKMARQEITLSLEDRSELRELLRGLSEALGQLAQALAAHERAAFTAVAQAHARLAAQVAAMRRAHFQAVADGIPAALKSSEYFLDILSELESSLNKLAVLTHLARETED